MNNATKAKSIELIELANSAGAKQIARAYNMDVQIYQESKSITVQKNCAAFQFTNVGDTVAFVNGMVIFPSATPTTAIGDSRSIGLHVLDLYKGNIVLGFQQPLGVNPSVEVVQLYYSEAYEK